MHTSTLTIDSATSPGLAEGFGTASARDESSVRRRQSAGTAANHTVTPVGTSPSVHVPASVTTSPAAAAGPRAKLSFWSWVSAHLFALLGTTLLFNLFDAVLTLALVTGDLAVEANPIMAYFLELGPVAFMVAKISLVSVGVGVLWYFRRFQLALAGAVAVFTIYALLMAYHLQSIYVLLGL